MVNFVRHAATQKTNNRRVATFVNYVGRHLFAFYLANPFFIEKSDIDLRVNWNWKKVMDCLLGSRYKTGDPILFRDGVMSVLLKNLHKPAKILSLDMFCQYCRCDLPWYMAERMLWRLCAFYSESSLYECGTLERLLWLPSRVALFSPSTKLLIKNLNL